MVFIKGRPSSFKGKTHSIESRKLMGISRIGNTNCVGRVMSEETKKKISESEKGKVISREQRKKLSIAGTGRIASKETLRKMSNARKGIMPKVLMMPGKWGHIHRGYHDINGKQMFFRSGWEVTYALYLDFLVRQKKIEKWEYEVDIFWFEKIKRGVRSYLPDFKVFNFDGTFEYHEVKGYMDAKSSTKLKRMGIYYPKTKVILIGRDEMKEVKKWERLY